MHIYCYDAIDMHRKNTSKKVKGLSLIIVFPYTSILVSKITNIPINSKVRNEKYIIL